MLNDNVFFPMVFHELCLLFLLRVISD